MGTRQLLAGVSAFAAALTAAAAMSAETVDSGLEEVVVTARKRVESLQSVPVSAAVISGATIQDHAIASLQDLSNTLPAVKLSRGSTTDRLFIRGVGSGDNPSFEQSVGTFVDDVYHGRARLSQGDLFDVARVEVLKGPQMTYFGNNAIAGAVNVTSNEPRGDFDADLRALYNLTFDDYLFEGAVSQLLTDDLSVRIAGLASGGDGWIEDRGAGEDVPERDDRAARATLLWGPSEAFTAKLKIQYADENQRGGLPIVRGNCPAAAAFGPPAGFCALALAGPGVADFDWFERSSSPGQVSEITSREAVATLSYSVAGNTLTSVTAYTDYDYVLRSDLDTTPAHLFSIAAPEQYEQFSQELRFDSHGGDTIDYLVGMYYQSSKLDVRNDFNYAFLSPAIAAVPTLAPLLPYLPIAEDIHFRSDDESISGFGAVTWNMSANLRATTALRYTRVDKDFDQTLTFGRARGSYGPVESLPVSVAALANALGAARGLGVAGNIALSRTDDHVSPSLSVEYDATQDTMLYARYDNGFKAGGFNGADTSGDRSALAFGPETVDAFEIGIKNRLFDDRVMLNFDLFRGEYSDLQLAGVVPSTSGAYVNRVQNAGGAISQGAELELAWEINGSLRSSLSVTALDAHYTRYPNATPTAQQAAAGQRFQDLSDRPILFAPDVAGQWTLSWSRMVAGNLELTIASQLYASSGYFLGFSDDPYLKQSGYVREDATVTLTSPHGWELSLIGKNLADTVIRTYGAALPTSTGSYVFITEPSRSVAIQASYRF
jgi:outer membrane receptor protein involved in Fe transport